MTQHNARLLNEPRLRKIVETTDEITSHAQDIADALCDYESASDLSGEEKSEAREDARSAFVEGMESLLGAAASLKAEYEKITSDGQEFSL